MPSQVRCFLSQRAAEVGCRGILFGALLLIGAGAHAQVSGETDVDLSQESGNETECAIAKNPLDKDQIFVACNNDKTVGFFAARSTNGGQDPWIYPYAPTNRVADAPANIAAARDPSLAWDTFGNLYLTYINIYVDPTFGVQHNIVTLLSTDGGATFPTVLARFPGGAVDQPTVVTSTYSDSGGTQTVAVWIAWNEDNKMRARGAEVRGGGLIDPFGPRQDLDFSPGCTFGDIAISPTGAVVVACQDLGGSITGGSAKGPSTIFVSIKSDGLGPGTFGPPIPATTTNVGAVKQDIPALISTSGVVHNTDAEAGLVFDSYAQSSNFKRLYLVYTDETVFGNHDTDIMLRFSDNNGMNWSDPPIRVNDDPPGLSQFLPRIASNPLSGNIAVCWLDARNDPNNKAVQTFCSMATPTGAMPSFLVNKQISDTSSISSGQTMEFGDYTALAYFEGIVHPAWGDNSNSGGKNPDHHPPNTPKFDAYTDRVTGGQAASEGEPHITTLDGVHYDFQSAGEFVALRGDGLEIQTRQTAIGTPFPSAPNPQTGLATCVSLNSAFAAGMGGHKVTYQPDVNGVADPSGLHLRVDGEPRTLGAEGIEIESFGRVVKSAEGNGIEIEFTNGTHLIAVPRWWAAQNKWFLNLNVYQTTATEGLMGVIARGSWLPALPDGTSVGSKPANSVDRYRVLNKTFADAWRVTKPTKKKYSRESLFDYKDTSFKTFNIPGWPPDKPPCVVPKEPQTAALNENDSRAACAGIVDKNRSSNCVFDVTITGETGFAQGYVLTEKLEAGATITTVYGDKKTSRFGDTVFFSARVTRKASHGKQTPTGTIQFMLNGSKIGSPAGLDSNGRAELKIPNLKAGKYRLAANYSPSVGSEFLPSSSRGESHTVVEK